MKLSDRPAGAVRAHLGLEPDLAGAALHLVASLRAALRNRRKRAAELDDVAVAVVPLVEQREIVENSSIAIGLRASSRSA